MAMADVDEIIYYMKSLKKGFDKDLFQSKIEDLAHAVDTSGLEYDDFHTLFKVWLNLSIPITKWNSLGSCLVPPDLVEERTVEYAIRWILTNFKQQSCVSRIGFLLDWLTVAMECESIDMIALDTAYEVFYTILMFDGLAVHAVKLVYTLTKPADVTRRRVLELIDNAKRREAKKSMYRQLQVLLGLFKSYKPECVPEDIPAISILTAFKKLNVALVERFRKNQQRRNKQRSHKQHLMWINPINSDRSRNKISEPLVPNVEFVDISRQRVDKEPAKTYMDFSDPASLVQSSRCGLLRRPARLRSLLCSTVGQLMLAAMDRSQQAFFSHDLHHLLNICFLEVSPYSYNEKRDLLQKLAMFQRTLVQGIPVITRFLAQYLTLWNEKDFFAEICELVEWVSADSPQQVQYVCARLARVHRRAQPLHQCTILRALTCMYVNLIYASKKDSYHFLNSSPSPNNYTALLPTLAETIVGLSSAGLQVDPDDYRILYTSIQSSLRRGAAEVSRGTTVLPSVLTLALPLLGPSPGLIDDMAALLIQYKNIISVSPATNEHHLDTLSRYTSDMLNCLYSEEILTERENGVIFQKLDKSVVEKLKYLMPDVDSKLSIRNHLAFASNTYIPLAGVDDRDATNKMWFKYAIEENFPSLRRFLKRALPELRN